MKEPIASSTVFQKPKQWLHRLIAPALHIENVQVQQEAILLTIILLMQSVLLVLLFALHVVAGFNGYDAIIVFGLLFAVTWVSFTLIRHGRHMLGGWVYLGMIGLALVLIIVWGPQNPFVTGYLVSLMVLVGSLFLRTQQVIAVSLVGILLQIAELASAPADTNLLTIVITTVGLMFVLTVIITSAYWRDLNSRLIAEQAKSLEESEQRFQSIYDQTFQLIGFLNPDGTIMNANQRTMQLMEMTGTYAIGQVIWELPIWQMTNITADTVKLAVQRAAQGHTSSLEVIFNIPNQDKPVVYDVWIRPVYNQVRDIFIITMDARDITERFRAEQQRQQDRARYRALFEQMNDGVFVMGLDNRLIAVNQVGAEMLGYEPKEMIGMSLIDVTVQNSADRTSAYRIVDELLLGKKFRPYEREVTRHDGGKITIEISPSVVLDEEGQPLHVQTIFRDLTARKEHQRSELQLRVERERVKILENFITSVSHDLRTPLSNIKTSTYLIRRSIERKPERVPQYLDVIDDAANQLHRMIDDQLDVVRAESSQGETKELGYHDVRINDVIREVLKEQQDRAQLKNHKVILNLEVEVPPVMGSSRALHRALHHIIQNAHQYTPTDGEVKIETHYKDEMIYIDVIDNGIGIEEKDIPYIFDSLYRANSARTETGAGVGLSIAYKIIRSHGGNITVKSEVDKGSTFTISLPQIPDTEKSTSQE